MAKVSKIVPVRIPVEMLNEMALTIKSRNKNTQEEPWLVSDFIRHCIRVKLAHNARSKKVKGKKGKMYTPGLKVIE